MNRLVLIFLILSTFYFDRFQSETDFDDIWRKRVFVNHIENQREQKSFVDKRQRLARAKFEEHCEPKGKMVKRICPTIDECLSSTVKEETRSVAHQFLHRIDEVEKRGFFSSFISKNDDFYEKNVDERRRKGFYLYEKFCESTDRSARVCPSIERCQ